MVTVHGATTKVTWKAKKVGLSSGMLAWHVIKFCWGGWMVSPLGHHSSLWHVGVNLNAINCLEFNSCQKQKETFS